MKPQILRPEIQGIYGMNFSELFEFRDLPKNRIPVIVRKG